MTGIDHPMGPDQIAWRDGTPVSTLYGDPFFSLQDGLAETRHVFLAGNGLPERFCPGFHIAELGFGTGLNALVAWAAWQQAGCDGPLRLTSFEAHPLDAADMARAQSAFPALAPFAAPLLQAWQAGQRRIRLDGLDLSIIEGDAATTVPSWTGQADAWFLDGFAPSRNPALWSDGLMDQVGRHTKPGGTFATYTAAGHVRRALTKAGFDVHRTVGFGRKRHMSVGTKPATRAQK